MNTDYLLPHLRESEFICGSHFLSSSFCNSAFVAFAAQKTSSAFIRQTTLGRQVQFIEY
ncbi:hypothetical protein [Novipirellula sp.]|uniref:hypothetical protein n=1 Tax=Novipirellula sp. TaxID=2795430 RepID=UPI003562E28F